MSDFITLSCPSCGGKLQITSDIERFACTYCGTEQVVKRSGGVVSLAPVMEGLQKVQASSDRVGSELAIQRLSPAAKAAQAAYEKAKSNAKIAARMVELHSRNLTILFGVAFVISIVVLIVVILSSNVPATSNFGACFPLAAAIVFGALVLMRQREVVTYRRNREVAQAKLSKAQTEYEALQGELDQHFDNVKRAR